MAYLAERKRDRIQALLDAAERPDDPRTIVETVLLEALPVDDESRTFQLVYTAYAVDAATDPALAVQPFLRAPDAMEAYIADRLRGSSMAADHEPRTEAALLLAMSAGFCTSVLLGQRTAEDAAAAIRYHLDRIGLRRADQVG